MILRYSVKFPPGTSMPQVHGLLELAKVIDKDAKIIVEEKPDPNTIIGSRWIKTGGDGQLCRIRCVDASRTVYVCEFNYDGGEEEADHIVELHNAWFEEQWKP